MHKACRPDIAPEACLMGGNSPATLGVPSIEHNSTPSTYSSHSKFAYMTIYDCLRPGWNSLGALGAAKLSSGLRANGTLRILELSYNGLGQAGASHVGRALVDNGGLTELDLSSNGVGSRACSVRQHVHCRKAAEMECQQQGKQCSSKC
eukprot:evm.model.scf_576.1 EVM.evm.TU.scf_576.1   scf_576:446-892(+)